MQSLSPVTDAESATDDIICERSYLPGGWVPADIARKMEIQLRTLLNLMETHDVIAGACDQDDDKDCNCLQRQVKMANDMLNEF